MGFLLYSPLAIYSALCSPAIYLVCVTFLLPAVLDAFCHCLLSPLSSVCSFRLNFLDERLAECEQMPKDVVSQLRLSKWHSLHRYRSALSTGSSSKGAATTPTLANQPSALLDEFDDAASDISTGTCSACFFVFFVFIPWHGLWSYCCWDIRMFRCAGTETTTCHVVASCRRLTWLEIFLWRYKNDYGALGSASTLVAWCGRCCCHSLVSGIPLALFFPADLA